MTDRHGHHDLEARAKALAPGMQAASLRTRDGAAVWLEAAPDAPHRRRIGVLAPREHPAIGAFDGERSDAGEGLGVTYGPLGPATAAALRELLPDLRPVPLGLATSAGFGDRLGSATPGHVAALRRADARETIRPIFAQQSIREMTRTGRTPQQVMDDATFGAFEAGWTGGVGADADHLKTEADVRRTLEAGFAFFTFDPGDHVDDDAAEAEGEALRAKVEALPWEVLADRWDDLRARWLGSTPDADGLALTFDEATVARAAAKYGAALAQAARLHRALAESGRPFEIEFSVDETATPTTPEEHAFIAAELRRVGVPIVSLAPRFVGRFEKGVDYRGDLRELKRTLDAHARIARAFGPYKLSLHSGSDKFSVYPLIAEATLGRVHLKTAGTSYLEALRVAAVHAPELFREILGLARARFETDRASYLIGARLEAVPDPGDVGDDDLPGLLDDDDARQVLHVTFGSALDAHGDDLEALLQRCRAAHEDALARHFERHLTPFVPYAHPEGVTA